MASQGFGRCARLPALNAGDTSSQDGGDGAATTKEQPMSDDTLRRVATYLRQIEKLAEAGDIEAVLREARLALRLCEGRR